MQFWTQDGELPFAQALRAGGRVRKYSLKLAMLCSWLN
jgi:hypothetical protein